MAYLRDQSYKRVGEGVTWFVNRCHGDGVRCGSSMLCEAVDNSVEKEDREEHI